MASKLNRALEVIDRKVRESKPIEKLPEELLRNDWSHFERLEAERRAFVEASYRRFRTGSVVSAPEPHRNNFDYDDVEFELPSGETIKQPVAYPRSPTRVGMGPPTLNSVGINTTSLVPDDRSRFPSPPPSGNTDERSEYISKLVQSKVRDPPLISAGQRVDVCYYGVHFSGVVVKRNVGLETFTIRFNDGAVNDFPLSSIIIK